VTGAAPHDGALALKMHTFVDEEVPAMRAQRLWQRIILLIVLAYEGLGALAGGAFLVTRPDGSAMKMPVSLMHGVFADFLIPGIILLGLGVLNVVAFFVVLRRSRFDWLAAGLAMGGMAVWFFVEIVIIRELHWLHAMWGLPVILGGAMAMPLLPFRAESIRDFWLGAGIASSLLYVAMNVIVPGQWPGYSSASQIVSELSAVGAPSRPLWVIMALLYTVLVTGFGWGVWMAAAGGRGDRLLRIAGVLIAIYGALGIPWIFAPMHQREVLAAGGGTLSDTMHIALAVVTQILYLSALGLVAAALGTAFRLYSIATFVVLLLFGVQTFREAPGVSANQPTPLIGVWERINIGVFLAWVGVLAGVLLARSHAAHRRAPLHALPQPV
jgi:hypothetical protein